MRLFNPQWLAFLARVLHLGDYGQTDVDYWSSSCRKFDRQLTPALDWIDARLRVVTPHFHDTPPSPGDQPRDYFITLFTFITTTICLSLDGFAPKILQYWLAAFGWMFLLTFLYGECRFIRAQVAVAVAFALTGEYFASVFMGGYTYRFGNVPAYVPTGHGLVYLTAVVMARSPLFVERTSAIARFVMLVGALWAFYGLFISARHDVIGVVLYLAFLFCLYRGRSPRVYLAAFFITSWLELVGTTAGTWAWAVIDPASHLPQGNPPSGVAAWYCLVDAVAIGGAPWLLTAWSKLTGGFSQK